MPGTWRRLARSQRGQTAAEYMGVLLVVGVIIAAVAASPIAGTISSAIECEIESVATWRDVCERSSEEAPSGQQDRRSDSAGAADGGTSRAAQRLDLGQAQRTGVLVPASASSGRAPVMINVSLDGPQEQAGSACTAFARVPFGDAGSPSGARRRQAGECQDQLGRELDRLPEDQRRWAEEAMARALEQRGCGTSAAGGGLCSVDQILHVRYHAVEDLKNTPQAQRAQRARALAESRQQVGALRPPPTAECGEPSGIGGFLLGDACLALQKLGERDLAGGLLHAILAWPGGKPFKAVDEVAERAAREGTEEAGEEGAEQTAREGAEQTAREAAEQAAREAPSSPPRWIRGTQGNAGRIPESVAQQLRGRSFASRREFRETFWKTVADDPALAAHFGSSNVTLMRRGKAPFAARTQRYGGHERYVLHHRTPVSRGGAVYDPDNIMLATPRYHQEVLDGSYHFGRGD